MRERERGRQHSHHRARQAVYRYGLADDPRVRSETRLPQTIADENGLVPRTIVIFSEEAAERGLNAKGAQEVRRDASTIHLDGIATADKRERGVLVTGDVLEGVAHAPPVEIIRCGGLPVQNAATRVALPYLDQARGIGVWKGPEYHTIDEIKNGSVGANAEGESDGRNRRERGV